MKSTPADGDVIPAGSGERRRIVVPTATLSALNFFLPPNPVDGDTWQLISSEAITALTVSGAGTETVVGGSLSLAAGESRTWLYSVDDTTWYRLSA